MPDPYREMTNPPASNPGSSPAPREPTMAEPAVLLSPTPIPPEGPPVVVVPPSVPPPPPPSPPPPPPFDFKNPLSWPRWFKIVAAPVIFVILVFYYRDQRTGNGFFAPKADPPAAVKEAPKDDAWTVQLLKDPPIAMTGRPHDRKVTIKYGDKAVDADGLAVAVLTQEDGKKQLQALDQVVKPADYPVVVFMNATGFDNSGEPIAVRKFDGTLLYQQPKKQGPVDIVWVKGDGTFLVVTDGSPSGQAIDAKAFTSDFMRQEIIDGPVHAPKELEKLSDEELKKLGYDRLKPEEYKKRFGTEPPKPGAKVPVQLPGTGILWQTMDPAPDKPVSDKPVSGKPVSDRPVPTPPAKGK